MTKIIAFHLPQFHSIPENDEWWGKGFTEWVNTKKTNPLFQGHNQPRIPLDNNYYNLLDKQSLEWQANLAKEYGIYGFCFYHYWFNGKLLLEKPLEILLAEKEIDIPFCFCWANEPWTRAWDGGERQVLMPQYYGGEKEWKDHFEYLLPFFKDKRYIKKGGMPMLVMYRTSNIPNCDQMIQYWNELCRENGFNGIFVIEEANTFQHKPELVESSAYLEFEPMYTITADIDNIMRIKRKSRKVLKKLGANLLEEYDYDYIWKKIIERNRVNKEKKVYLGAFVDWDNTPRKGKNGIVFKGVSVEKFQYYISEQVKIANELESEYIFINAWNEWAEGTYLEPDEKNKYGYLEAIKSTLDK